MADGKRNMTARLRSSSLTKRVSVALLAMLVPVCVIGAAGLASLDEATQSFQATSEELIDESSRVVRIRDDLGRAEESLEEILYDGDAELLPVVERLVDRLDHELANEGAWDEPAERRVVAKIARNWAQARDFFLQVLAATPERREALAQQNGFHSDLDDAVVLLNKLDALALEEGAGEAAAIYTDSDRRRQLLLFGAVLAAATAASVLLARRFRRSLLRPLDDLRTAALRFGSDDLDYRVPVDCSDELGDVVCAFNKMAERLSHSRSELLHSQRMEGIGQLAGGVAHDFNNLLSVIQNFATFVAEDMAPDDPSLEDIHEIQMASTKATALTRQLLTFSRKDDALVQTFDPNAALEQARGLIVGALSEDVELSLSLDAPECHIEMDPSQFDQLLLNLVVNARDAMPTGGRLTIDSSRIVIEEDVEWGDVGLAAGDYVVIAVSDTGCGMSGDVKDRIFEPFFTTKDRATGTGLGLATVYGIVTRAGGTIAVYSEVGLGTTFKVYLPVARQLRRAVEEGPARGPAAPGKGATVLVVEDEEGVRKIVDRILSKSGYSVLMAARPEEALHINRSFEGEIDLLITDVIMPGQNGKSLVQQIHATRPEVPVVYMSGYTDSIVSARGLLQDERLLQKPFAAGALLGEVERAMQDVRDLSAVGM